MNPTTDQTTSGDAQIGTAPPAAQPKEGSEAPSAEATAPYVPTKKKTAPREDRRVIYAGAAVALILVVAALTQVPGSKSPSASAKDSKHPATTQPAQPEIATYGSSTPINETQTADHPPDRSKIDAGTIARTAKPGKPPAGVTTLSDIRPFDNGSWQPAPYQLPSPEPSSSVEVKSEREATDKASLIFVRNASTARESTAAGTGEFQLSVGLPPGARLRAHLESAVNTAVKTPVVAVVEYNYERGGELLIPAGSKAFGHLQSADSSGYIGVRFDSLETPDGATMNIDAAATDLALGPLRGKVEGKNARKNVLVRSFAGIGEAAAMLVGQGSLNQPLSQEDLLRSRVTNNIGQASDEQVERLTLGEHIVVSLSANTEIYVVLEKSAKEPPVSHAPQGIAPSSTSTEQLRQLLQLQKELNGNLSPSMSSVASNEQ